MATVDAGRLTAEHMVAVGILRGAAESAVLRKAQREAEAPLKKSLPLSRGPTLCRELRSRTREPLSRMGP